MSDLHSSLRLVASRCVGVDFLSAYSRTRYGAHSAPAGVSAVILIELVELHAVSPAKSEVSHRARAEEKRRRSERRRGLSLRPVCCRFVQ